MEYFFSSLARPFQTSGLLARATPCANALCPAARLSTTTSSSPPPSSAPPVALIPKWVQPLALHRQGLYFPHKLGAAIWQCLSPPSIGIVGCSSE